jgi:hypothetical protein
VYVNSERDRQPHGKQDEIRPRQHGTCRAQLLARSPISVTFLDGDREDFAVVSAKHAEWSLQSHVVPEATVTSSALTSRSSSAASTRARSSSPASSTSSYRSLKGGSQRPRHHGQRRSLAPTWPRETREQPAARPRQPRHGNRTCSNSREMPDAMEPSACAPRINAESQSLRLERVVRWSQHSQLPVDRSARKHPAELGTAIGSWQRCAPMSWPSSTATPAGNTGNPHGLDSSPRSTPVLDQRAAGTGTWPKRHKAKRGHSTSLWT